MGHSQQFHAVVLSYLHSLDLTFLAELLQLLALDYRLLLHGKAAGELPLERDFFLHEDLRGLMRSSYSSAQVHLFH